MTHQQRTPPEPSGSISADRDGGGASIGTLLFAAACGIGLGMLTAPTAGYQTRRRLGRRLTTLGGEVAARLGEMHERYDEIKAAGGRSGRRAKNGRSHPADAEEVDDRDRWSTAEARLAELEERLARVQEQEDEGERDQDEEERTGGILSAAIGIAAGAGIAYFLIADNAAPARTKVRQTASAARRQATNRWTQFRQKREQEAEASTPNMTFPEVDEA